MAQISLTLSDELLKYLAQKVDNPNALIESLLQQWRKEQEDRELARAGALVDDLELGWDEEWQKVAFTDWEVSG
jgi:antitoxin ParD1/3/4